MTTRARHRSVVAVRRPFRRFPPRRDNRSASRDATRATATGPHLQTFELSPTTPATTPEPVAGIGLRRDGTAKGGTPMDKPWNDVADQLRPAWPELDESEIDGLPDRDDTAVPGEADPADVADQRRVVPLPDDEQDPAGVRP